MKYPNIEDGLLGDLENIAYNAGYDSDFSDPQHIVFTPREDIMTMPTIHGEFQTDSEGHFWWEAHMEDFPERLNETSYTGHFNYILSKWLDAGQIADYLGSHWWKFEDLEEE